MDVNDSPRLHLFARSSTSRPEPLQTKQGSLHLCVSNLSFKLKITNMEKANGIVVFRAVVSAEKIVSVHGP